MPRGGTLTLATTTKSLSSEDAESYDFPLQPGHYVSLTVRDTGIGMSQEVRNRVFEPFFTTKELGEGSGLGLSTAYGIVKQSGGFISIESDRDRGTSVEILLPRTDEVGDETPIPGRAPGDSVGRETLLVVEDEAPLRELLTEILLRHGYTVLEAGGGREAIQVADRFPGRIHLLITDIVMPDMRGPDLERKLRTDRPETRVLFISGYPGNDAVFRGDLSHGHPFLQKPFDQATLVGRVRDILDGQE
jgi:CheY-like chemotaxis protein